MKVKEEQLLTSGLIQKKTKQIKIIKNMKLIQLFTISILMFNYILVMAQDKPGPIDCATCHVKKNNLETKCLLKLINN